MREILFRGKRLCDQKWTYGSLIKLNGQDVIFSIDGCSCGAYDIDPDTLGQYTGLTDKGGVKIFEGDTILIGNSTKPAHVEFKNSSWESVRQDYSHRLEIGGPEYEVIGNIYDNPRL